MFRIFVWFILLLCLTFGGAVFYFSWSDMQPRIAVSAEGLTVPEYREVELEYAHTFTRSRHLPYAAGAVIDVDNDGIEELFIGGGVRQTDGLFVYLEDHFVNVVDQAGLVKQGDSITLGATVIDLDNNGFQDLIISREKAVWLYYNDNGKFTSQKLDIEFSPQGAPLAVALADLNRDGHIDFFVPVAPRQSQLGWYSSEKQGNNIRSRLFINNGDNSFTDITEGAGLGSVGGAIQAIFTDLDRDGAQDLAVLHADGGLSLWTNQGDLLFARNTQSVTELEGNFLGMAAADYNDDEAVDFLLTGTGTTIPAFIRRWLSSGRNQGRNSQWQLFTGEVSGSFEENTAQSGLADYQLARGIIWQDMNGDGRVDLVASQNHPYWPPYLFEFFRTESRLLLQRENAQFADATASAGIANRSYSVSPLTADFNKDGRSDIVFINLNAPSKVFMSRAGDANYLNVELADTARSYGALVTVKTLSGVKIEQTYAPVGQLCSDSSHILHFNLQDEKATDVVVEYVDGDRDLQSGVLYNTTLIFDRL